MAAGGLFAAAAVVAPAAEAANFEVNLLGDPGDGTCDATCTLRDAIDDANSNGLADTITFAANVRGTIQLANGLGSSVLPITNESLDIVGPGADQLTIRAGNSSRVFKLFGFDTPDEEVTISGLTLDGGNPLSGGGFGECAFDDAKGGAILSTNTQECFPDGHAAALTVSKVVITDSFSPVGGGIAVTHREHSTDDKAPTGAGSLNVIDSTIYNNESNFQGGGIAIEPGTGALHVSNSTIADNTAGGPGGGISVIRQSFNKVPAPAGPATTVNNSTISGNDGGPDEGGGIYTTAADVGLRSTIVHGNTVTENEEVSSKVTTASDLGNDVSGEFNAGYSLIGTRDGVTVNDVPGEPNLSSDPQLGALQNNGGTTPTMLPATTSPAIDTGVSNALSADQRGLTRTADRPPANAADGTDIGAVEIPADPVVEPDPEPQPIPGPATELCLGKQVILTKGGDANETLTGTGVDDGILGGGGLDTIDGLGGDDCLFGQIGNDLVVGGPGNDNANGDRDNDTVKGDDGIDSVRGQNGNDKVFGGAGDDPKVTGGAGDDKVSGGSGDDLLKGDGGNDKLNLGSGEDFVHAGGGADEIDADDGEKDRIICGTGKDVAKVDAIDKVDEDCNTVIVG